MKKELRNLMTTLLICTAFQLQSFSQYQYNDYNAISSKLRSLSTEYPKLCSLKSLVKTAGGKEIWMLSIGTGEKDSKPGIAVFGGVEGNHILGRELALGFASSLLKESSGEEITALLGKVTFYVFPDVSPDASAQFFSDLKYVRTGNARSTDDDRDFVYDEDGNEDLNKDGLITLMRIKDPAGKFIKSSEDERVMVEADPSKGQIGQYLVYSEGTDNDGDGLFNEDGPGGVDFNRNFTFNYEFFGVQAGMYPVSEPETKAVADFLFDRFNIFSVFTFGPQDNLGQPMKAETGSEKSGVIKTVMKEDEPVNRLISDKYHEITGVTGAPVPTDSRGNFMEWAYFHYGRYSFGTPAWWFPVEKDKNAQAAFLKYVAKGYPENVFVPWTEITHPDFPGKTTEVGGIKQFAMMNPPADSLESLISKNYKFLKYVATLHPQLEFLDIKTEKKGEGIFRITLKLHNSGQFATLPKIGEENMYTRIMRITAGIKGSQAILSGPKVQQVNRLEGGQSAEFSWLVSGSGQVKITAGALNTGMATTTVELR
jgi:hypothetical protein